MLLSIECDFIKNRSTVQGQTITGNCCTHVIGWTRWWLTHISCGNRFHSSILIYKVCVSDGKNGHLGRICNTYFCRHSFICRYSNTFCTIILYQIRRELWHFKHKTHTLNVQKWYIYERNKLISHLVSFFFFLHFKCAFLYFFRSLHTVIDL